jgi:predicted GH43/DUF377 family glycosyl hydrolase
MNLSVTIILTFVCVVAILWLLFELFRHVRASRWYWQKRRYHLTRHDGNPVISPLPHKDWELNGTFNPATIVDDEGKVHLLYRAIGDDGLSRVGHAKSDNGYTFDERSQYPVFEPIPGYGLPEITAANAPHLYNPEIYLSGGGWGGCEDPRTVRIGDRVYMSYVAFEGWNSVRIGLTSISLKDYKQGRWNWRRPLLISPKGEVNKNWVIFPEKINGKYAILHSIVPRVQIAYVESLDSFSKPIESPRAAGPQPGRKNFWDNRIRGAGPPPVKTEKGWLLFYHAQDLREPHKYKLGVMLLDLNDPTRILYRSPMPILEPDMHYENDGKPGIVYASGAAIIGDDIMVYYGGGDRHVCIAQTPLQGLLDWLQKYGKV